MLELGLSIVRGGRLIVVFNGIEIYQFGSLRISAQVVRGVDYYIIQRAVIKSN